MTLFFPDLVLPKDPAGFGKWLLGHSLEHKQFIISAAGLTPSITVQDFDILSWNDNPGAVASWLNNHNNIHLTLRQPFGIPGIDLASVDFTKDDQFQEWLEDHRVEHQLLREAYGLT